MKVSIMNFAKSIRIARSLADMTQAQLAKASSIDRSYLSLLEAGHRNPSVETIQKLANALKIPPQLMTLLSLEGDDSQHIDQREIEILAKALAELILSKGADDANNRKSSAARKSDPESKHKKSSRSRASAGHRSRLTA
jgi:transcriptional regulator with XRE-family HTH domain